jgi:NAD(P)-dependent dehydrogenase (short-subunit alcohol dehydrogenase family)
MAKKVCVVVGVGPGNGAALGRRFAKEGYAVALLARTTETSEALAKSLPDARAYACDVSDAAAVARTFDAIEREMGPVATLVYNAGSGTWGTVEEIEPAALEGAFRVNTLGLLLAAKKVIPQMKAQGGGNIVVIGATSSRRGVARTAAFAPAKAAQKSLCESMARHLWPQNIHVSLIIVDGVVDLPRTRAFMKDKPDDFFIAPDAVADTALHLTTQNPAAWSFEVEARPFKETW